MRECCVGDRYGEFGTARARPCAVRAQMRAQGPLVGLPAEAKSEPRKNSSE